MTDDLRLRPCRGDDVEAILELDGWALHEAGTDPADVPGSGDLRELPASYREAGGEFVVGTLPAPAAATSRRRCAASAAPSCPSTATWPLMPGPTAGRRSTPGYADHCDRYFETTADAGEN